MPRYYRKVFRGSTMPLPRRRTTGVYLIHNSVNRKNYVGSTGSSFEGRWRRHRYSLKTNTHANRHLQAAWNKYGSLVFQIIILERCDPEDCLAREQFWIDRLKSSDETKGYNICPVAGSVLGCRWDWSDESKQRQREYFRENPRQFSIETIKKRTESIRRFWANQEERRKHSVRMKRAKINRSPATNRRKSIALTILWEDGGYRASQIEGLTRGWTGDKKAARVAALQNAWNDPIKRAKRLAKLRATRKTKKET